MQDLLRGERGLCSICVRTHVLMLRGRYLLKAVLLKIRTPPHILAPWIGILVAKYHLKHTESSKFYLSTSKILIKPD